MRRKSAILCHCLRSRPRMARPSSWRTTGDNTCYWISSRWLAFRKSSLSRRLGKRSEPTIGWRCSPWWCSRRGLTNFMPGARSFHGRRPSCGICRGYLACSLRSSLGLPMDQMMPSSLPNLPGALLLGPDGKIAATDLHGDAIKAAVAKALSAKADSTASSGTNQTNAASRSGQFLQASSRGGVGRGDSGAAGRSLMH